MSEFRTHSYKKNVLHVDFEQVILVFRPEWDMILTETAIIHTKRSKLPEFRTHSYKKNVLHVDFEQVILVFRPELALTQHTNLFFPYELIQIMDIDTVSNH